MGCVTASQICVNSRDVRAQGSSSGASQIGAAPKSPGECAGRCRVAARRPQNAFGNRAVGAVHWLQAAALAQKLPSGHATTSATTAPFRGHAGIHIAVSRERRARELLVKDGATAVNA